MPHLLACQCTWLPCYAAPCMGRTVGKLGDDATCHIWWFSEPSQIVLCPLCSCPVCKVQYRQIHQCAETSGMQHTYSLHVPMQRSALEHVATPVLLLIGCVSIGARWTLKHVTPLARLTNLSTGACNAVGAKDAAFQCNNDNEGGQASKGVLVRSRQSRSCYQVFHRGHLAPAIPFYTCQVQGMIVNDSCFQASGMS